MRLFRCFSVLCLLLSCAAMETSFAAQCPPQQGVALQVLGSGGPIADDGRASSSYLLWIDGRSRVLIDAGGGAFLRFGEAKAQFPDLDFVGLSHFHADHSADFSALLKSGYFSKRERPLTVAGPGAGGPFPGLGAFLASLIDKDSGAFAYLGGYLDGDGGLPRLDVHEIDSSTAVTVLGDSDSKLQTEAMRVPHGIVPALAFRVRIDDAVIIFSGDQNGQQPNFVEFAKDADLLVMHMPIPEQASGPVRELHATPGIIGAIAASANPKTLVLSHFMQRSERNLDDNVDVVRSRFKGHIAISNDLSCYVVGRQDEEH